MFHPLLPSMSELKDADIENKISELTQKYGIAARMGYGDACSQLLLALSGYKEEMSRRLAAKAKVSVKNQDRDLDDLINVN